MREMYAKYLGIIIKGMVAVVNSGHNLFPVTNPPPLPPPT